MNLNIINKTYRMVCALLVGIAITACSGLDDSDHYKNTDSFVDNEELKITGMGSEEYIKSRSDLSSMSKLFEQEGIYSTLAAKGQASTLLVIDNEHFNAPEADKCGYITRSHVSDIAISPANMHNGERLMMWHGKYVNIAIDEQGQQGMIIDHIKFNNATVQEVIKTGNGFIYVISEMINTPTSLFDYINQLGSEYSIFKELVLRSGERIFDKANSKPVGVNNEGNTVYDSVFIYKNSFFESKGFDMNSESLTATMLLFSDDVINSALDDAKKRLDAWGLERNADTLRNWILKTAFFNKRYSPDEMQGGTLTDINSVFGTQWRTTAQQVDTQSPVQLSNCVVYNVEKLHLPVNLLIYRLKDYFYYYENCTDKQKEDYFETYNLTYGGCDTEVAAWTPWAGVWPTVENRVLKLNKAEGIDDTEGFRLDFTPVMLKADGTVQPYHIPPGSYRLAMGFVQNAGFDITVTVVVNGMPVASSPVITLGSSTAYHYDRGTTLSNRYPEGYNDSYVREQGGNSKAGNYDTDGGPIIDEITIPDTKGDGSAQQITLIIESENWNTKTQLKLHHWCLRPTQNNY